MTDSQIQQMIDTGLDAISSAKDETIASLKRRCALLEKATLSDTAEQAQDNRKGIELVKVAKDWEIQSLKRMNKMIEESNKRLLADKDKTICVLKDHLHDQKMIIEALRERIEYLSSQNQNSESIYYAPTMGEA